MVRELELKLEGVNNKTIFSVWGEGGCVFGCMRWATYVHYIEMSLEAYVWEEVFMRM